MFVSNLIYIVLQVYLIDLKLFNKQDNLAFEIRVKNQQYLKYEYQKNRYKRIDIINRLKNMDLINFVRNNTLLNNIGL